MTFLRLPAKRASLEHSWEQTAAQLKQAGVDEARARYAAAMAPDWDREHTARRYGEPIATCLDKCREMARKGSIKALVRLANELSVLMERRGLSG